MLGVFFVEAGGGNTFDLSDEFCDGYFGWDGNDHVYVVFNAAKRMKGGFEGVGLVAHVIVDDGFYLRGKERLSFLRGPNQVVKELPVGHGCFLAWWDVVLSM